MSLGHGASLARNGLVLHLDAANPKSYPGSGNNWYDLNKVNNGILINSPVKSSNGNGSFELDGVNNYISIDADDSTNLTGSFTVSMLCKSNSGGWSAYWAGVSKYNQFILGPTGNNGKMAFLVHSGNWYPTNYNTTSVWKQTDIDPTDYHLYTGVYDKTAGYSYLYIDDRLECSFNIGSLTLTDDPNGFVIGKRDVSTHYLKMSLLDVKLYNKALSHGEIKQNFQALRGRYLS